MGAFSSRNDLAAGRVACPRGEVSKIFPSSTNLYGWFKFFVLFPCRKRIDKLCLFGCHPIQNFGLFTWLNTVVLVYRTVQYGVSQKKRNTNSTGCHASHVEFNDLILT